MSNPISQQPGDSNAPASPDAQQLPPTGRPSLSGRGNTVLIVLANLGGAMLLCRGVLGVLVSPGISATHRMQRSYNLKMIGLGIHHYHAAFDRLPMTVSASSKGEETIGWRIAISPFIEGQPAWEATDSTQPWNSDTNSALASLIPMSFQMIDGPP